MTWSHVAQVAVDAGISMAIPAFFGLAWQLVGSYITNKDMQRAAHIFGGVAYTALVAATSKGKFDLNTGLKAGIAAGIEALNSAALPSIRAMSDERKGALVHSGLADRLSADPTFSIVPTQATEKTT